MRIYVGIICEALYGRLYVWISLEYSVCGFRGGLYVRISMGNFVWIYMEMHVWLSMGSSMCGFKWIIICVALNGELSVWL